MRVLVTGGSGFLGAWVVRQLAEAGHEPLVFDVVGDRSKVAEIAGQRVARDMVWVVGDIRKAQDVSIAAQGCDAIIHLAGVLTPACQQSPVRGAEINLIGTLNVFEAARQHGIHSIAYASTAGVFGREDNVHPVPETHYGAFKLACEGSARAYWQDVGIGSVGFRPFVVYGPGRDGGLSAGPSLACRAAAKGEAYAIPFTGRCGMVYVEDAAALFVRAALQRHEGAHVFNLVGEEASMDDVIAGIRATVPDARLSSEGPSLPISVGQTETGLDAHFPGMTRTSLADGLKATIRFYQEQSAAAREGNTVGAPA